MDDPSCSIAPVLSVGQTDQRRGRAARVVSRPWRNAVLVSVGLHLLLGVLLLLMVRSKPADPAANPVGTVELLMVEKKGSGPPAAASPPDSSTPPTPAAAAPPPPAPAEKAAPPKQAAPAAPVPPTLSDEAGEPVPPAAPEEPKPAEMPAPAATPPPQEVKTAEGPAPQPAPPPQQKALVFNLEGTDSESNATAMGDRVIPASPDDRFRNRPPVYPYDAAVRGEHGAVLLVIHVAENGASTGADVVSTSGIASLDRAALDAVRKWHFRPALKDGRTVPFDMPMRFIFDSE